MGGILALIDGACAVVAAITATLRNRPADEVRKPDVIKKASAEPRGDRETGRKEGEVLELTSLQEKLAVLDRRVYELRRGPEPKDLFDMVKEVQALCEELLMDPNTPEEVQSKARVLRDGIVFITQVNTRPAADRDEFVGFLAEANKDGNLDSLIAKIKTMTPEEFTAAEQKRFSTYIAVLLTSLFGTLGAREKIGRDRV